MATRWWWCSARAAALLGLAACVRTTTVTYLPSAEQPRLGLDEARGTLATFVGVECARLLGEGRAEGAARVLVALDSAGEATSSELATTTGDARVDGIVGAVAAQLRLDAPAAARGGPAALLAGYRCADDGGVAVTLEPEAGA